MQAKLNKFVPIKNPTTPHWGTSFGVVNLRTLNDGYIRGAYLPSEGRVALITRSGFEQKHICTNQIASM